MAFDTSEILGEPQLAGSTVNPSGFGKKAGLRQVGVVGEAALAAGAIKTTPSQTPSFPRIAYLAVTRSEVALVAIDSGAVKGKLGQVLARVPRTQVVSAEVGKGMLNSPVTIAFSDGGSWHFEVSRVIKKGAQTVVDALAVA